MCADAPARVFMCGSQRFTWCVFLDHVPPFWQDLSMSSEFTEVANMTAEWTPTSWLSLSPIPALGLHTCTPHLSLHGHWGSDVSSCLHGKHTNHRAMSCSELVFLMHRFQNLFPLVLNSARKQRVGVKENGFPALNHFQTSPRSDKFLSNWK